MTADSASTASAQRLELLRRLRGGGGRSGPVIPRRAEGASAPASSLQQGLWFIDVATGPTAAYNLPAALRLRGALDVAALRTALTALVARHESLRTTIREVDGVVTQLVGPARSVDLAVTDLTARPGAGRETELAQTLRRIAREPFDLATGPLFRATLVRVATDEHVLVLTLHHIVADGWSMGVALRELAEFYRAGVQAGPPRLAGLDIQYGDYAAWQQQRFGSPEYERDLRFWLARLDGAPSYLNLATDHPRPAEQSFDGAEVHFRFDDDVVAAIRDASREQRTTTFMTVLAAFQVVLARYCRQDDIVLGTPVAGRTQRQTEPVVGMFLNTVLLRADLSGDLTFGEHLVRVRTTVLDALAHQELPLHHLVQRLRPDRGAGYTPYLQVMVDVASTDDLVVAMPGLRVEVERVDAGEAKFDLMLDIDDSAGHIRATLGYRTDLFEPATIERFARHLQRVLRLGLGDPSARISSIELADAAERERVLALNPPAPVRDEQCVHELIAARAAHAPDAVAVRYEGQQLRMRELMRRANQLARYLRERGVGPETAVGLCLPRSPEQVIALVGILCAGGAVVALDPEHPPQRVAALARDARLRLVVTSQDAQPAGLDDGGRIELVRVDLDAERIAAAPGAPVDAATVPANLAYLLFTSGSTGHPKAAMNTHRGIVAHLTWVQETYRLDESDRVLARTPPSFDDWVRELLWPLIAGACVVLAPPNSHRDPAALMRHMDAEGVTVLHVVPSLLQGFVEQPATLGRCASLRLVMTGGEALTESLQRAYRDRFDAPLVNHYGPTETAIDVTRWECAPGDGVPIGRPATGSRVYVLDAAGRPQPMGLSGELYIGGAQVGRGYLDRPGLTAAAFVPDPFAPTAGARMYRTGDVARWRGDGVLEYLGRDDDQLKVRGHRIEPAEVQRALLAHPAIREAAVIVREDRPGDRQLVAYCVPAGDEPDWPAVRGRLAAVLPHYLVPSAFVALPQLPRTTAGKLDRRALPPPGPAAPRTGVVAARTPTEAVVVRAWRAVFDRDLIDVRDDFFDLGGHSLLAVRVVARLREALKVDVPVNTLFVATTVEQLAAQLDRLLAQPSGGGATPIQRVDRGRYRTRSHRPGETPHEHAALT
ncbi:amino acid adenylation domain-containing protein [Dactylosporangium sp. NPDC000555]|uniref:non-ribosomal peptide synthetase n=1 Tax=Dactylosporangium sp. NPDC000555 TaxID=3154260 RepID=UPI00332F315C